MTEDEIKTVVRGWLDGVVIEAYRQDVGWTEIPTSIHPPCSDALFSEGWTFRLKPARKYVPHTKDTAPLAWSGIDEGGVTVQVLFNPTVHMTEPIVARAHRPRSGGSITFERAFNLYVDPNNNNPYGQLVKGGEG